MIIRHCDRADAVRAGCAFDEPVNLPIASTYAAPRSAYFVMELGGTLVGVAGVAPLRCDFHHIADLQRFVLLSMERQPRLGRRLLDHCLETAHRLGFRRCYVEVNSTQTAMTDLLKVPGFEQLRSPLRDPRRCIADTYYFLNLVTP
jgi:putative acetyltransferase